MPIDPKDIKIMLVEDAATMRKIEIKTLNSLGYDNIVECVNGDHAIKTLQEQTDVDLIISDWNMPEKDGYELLVWVRGNERYKNAPFLMATGQGDIQQEQKATAAGVSAFVAKPFNADELQRKIDEAFGLVETQKQISGKARKIARSSSGKVTLNVAHIQITDHLALGVLKHLIDKGDFTTRHFDLEIHCMQGWNPVRDALGRGSVDAACVLAPIAMDLFNYGTPIRLILLAHKNGSIFVRNRQGEYKEPYGNFFRKKSFFIPHKMSVHNMLSHMFFSRIGLKAGVAGERGVDVSFEVVDPIHMPGFLRVNPDAAGFMVAEPLGTKAIASGIAELQFLSSELWENHPCCVVAMRDDVIGQYEDAVYEFTEMLVQAGKFISKKPEMAAEVAVSFLDPQRKLGLKVPLLKNVLTEEKGIKSEDLFPEIEDLEMIQQYMFKNMGIGALIDMEKFVDIRFAEAACKDRVTQHRVSSFHDTEALALNILRRGGEDEEKGSKAMLNKEGKYLTFALGAQEFGIDILKIREIIGMMPVRTIPRSPGFIKGVINLRDKVIPVMDLRLRFGMDEKEYTDRTCIIIVEHDIAGRQMLMGIAVDSVSEVLSIRASEIEDTPSFGAAIHTGHILAVAKTGDGVKILLDIENILNGEKSEILEELV